MLIGSGQCLSAFARGVGVEYYQRLCASRSEEGDIKARFQKLKVSLHFDTRLWVSQGKPPVELQRTILVFPGVLSLGCIESVRFN